MFIRSIVFDSSCCRRINVQHLGVAAMRYRNARMLACIYGRARAHTHKRNNEQFYFSYALVTKRTLWIRKSVTQENENAVRRERTNNNLDDDHEQSWRAANKCQISHARYAVDVFSCLASHSILLSFHNTKEVIVRQTTSTPSHQLKMFKKTLLTTQSTLRKVYDQNDEN